MERHRIASIKTFIFGYDNPFHYLKPGSMDPQTLPAPDNSALERSLSPATGHLRDQRELPDGFPVPARATKTISRIFASRPPDARAGYSILIYSEVTGEDKPQDRLHATNAPRPHLIHCCLMKVSSIACCCVALFAAGAQQKPKKPADVQILETKAVREPTRITVDGKVRVTGEKPLHGLVIVFDFRSPEKEVVTTQKAVITEDTVETGYEGVYHSEMADAARAVEYTIRAFDMHEKELRIANTGPFPIE